MNPKPPEEDLKAVLTFVSRHGDTLWRLLQIAFFAAMFYANGKFVSRTDYEADRKADREVKESLSVKITDLTTELRILRERRNDDAAQNERLADHETRIRSLERR